MNKNILPYCFNADDTINWSYLETLPEISKLAECQQNPKWHSEGDALAHTKLASQKLEEVLANSTDGLSKEDIKTVRIATALHDVGKGVTTTLGKDGNWHQYGHEFAGEKIARLLLWDADIKERETICALIKYHMEPLRLFESKNWLDKLILIGSNVPWKLLWHVKMADLLGSVQENGGTMEQDIKKMVLIRNTARALNLWNATLGYELKKVGTYFGQNKYFPWTDNGSRAYVMIGLPGSGKNTWIEKFLPFRFQSGNTNELVEISRDLVRVELGYCKADEKYLGTEEEEAEVTKACETKLKKAMEEKRDIVINDINLKRKYRNFYNFMLRQSGYHITYVYVESPSFDETCTRRQDCIPPDVMREIALGFEWPETNEYDILTISKQR